MAVSPSLTLARKLFSTLTAIFSRQVTTPTLRQRKIIMEFNFIENQLLRSLRLIFNHADVSDQRFAGMKVFPCSIFIAVSQASEALALNLDGHNRR